VSALVIATEVTISCSNQSTLEFILSQASSNLVGVTQCRSRSVVAAHIIGDLSAVVHCRFVLGWTCYRVDAAHLRCRYHDGDD